MEYDSNISSFFTSYPIKMYAPITKLNQVTTALQSTTFHSLAGYSEGLSQTVSNTTPANLYSSQENENHLTLKLSNLPSVANIKTDIEYCLYVSSSGTFSLKLVFLDNDLSNVSETDSMVYDPENELNQPSIASLNGIKIKADLLDLPKNAQYVLVQVTMSNGSSGTFKYDYAKAISYHTVDIEPDRTSKAIEQSYLDLQFYNNRGSAGDIDSLTIKVNQNEADIADLETDKLDKTGGTITSNLTVDGNLFADGDYFRVGNGEVGLKIEDEFKNGGANIISFESSRPSTKFYFGETEILSLNTAESIFSSKLQILNELDVDNNKIINVLTPTEPNDAVNKQYMETYMYNILWSTITTSLNIEDEVGSITWTNIVSDIDGALSVPMIEIGSSIIKASAIGIAISSKTSTVCSFKIQLSTTNVLADMIDVTDFITVPEAPSGIFVKHKLITNTFFEDAQFMSIILAGDSGAGILTELVVYGL